MSLNEDVFEASNYCPFHHLLEKMVHWVPFVVFLHFLLKFKPFNEFFPSKTCIANLSECVAVDCGSNLIFGLNFLNRLKGDS